MGKLAISIILIITSLAFCQDQQDKMKLYKNPKDMKQEIIKYIPIGSSIKDAQRIMEANGFKCELKHGSFTVVNAGEPGPGVVYHNMDYLYCDKEVNSEIFSLRRWQISIVHKDGVVSDVFMSITTTSL